MRPKNTGTDSPFGQAGTANFWQRNQRLLDLVSIYVLLQGLSFLTLALPILLLTGSTEAGAFVFVIGSIWTIGITISID